LHCNNRLITFKDIKYFKKPSLIFTNEIIYPWRDFNKLKMKVCGNGADHRIIL